jgi:BioD-like phosphotransacetylase family protein
MKQLLFISTRPGAGKTSLIVGIGENSEKKIGYLKPLGDRLIYRRKINWDYDADLINTLWELALDSDQMTLGFNHSKIRYVHDPDSIQKEINGMVTEAGKGKDVLFIESGHSLSYGSSINLDAISLAAGTRSESIFVLSGDNDAIMDDVSFIKKNIDLQSIHIKGLIFNKVADVDDFEGYYLDRIQQELKVPVLGVIPQKEQLSRFSLRFLAEKFFAKVIAGKEGLDGIVQNIFVGAMSTDESLRNPLFNKQNKLLITSGDRSDMILAAFQSDTVGIILTNNLLPPSNIISKASEQKIPLLLVSNDTYAIAKQMDNFEPLLTKYSTDRIKMLKQLSEKYINIDQLLA